jgi:hypothetical protein
MVMGAAIVGMDRKGAGSRRNAERKEANCKVCAKTMGRCDVC